VGLGGQGVDVGVFIIIVFLGLLGLFSSYNSKPAPF